ncbi:MAG TPA: hypothetical protein ENO07_05650 [candidate division Zixibacteria bacterium]|nr:hypothetical protein [candidate division Zixibacteria bacterium]
MDVSIPTVLKALSSAGTAMKEFGAWKARARGDERALIAELKDNLHYLDLVAEDGVLLREVVGKLSVAEYKKLANRGFNFDTIKKKPIENYPSLAETDLAAWPGKHTGELIESIYDKINELKIKFPYVENNKHYRWNARVNNIRKRIWLLLRHVRG